MDENVANKIVRLVEQLADRDAAVEWDEVEELVRDFPGWLRLVQNTRYPSMTSAKYVVSMGSPLQYVVLPRVYRQKLLAFFRPYGILLDLRQQPAEWTGRCCVPHPRQPALQTNSFTPSPARQMMRTYCIPLIQPHRKTANQHYPGGNVSSRRDHCKITP